MADNYCESSFAVECSQEELDAWEAITNIAMILLTEDYDEEEAEAELKKLKDPQLVELVRPIAEKYKDWGTLDAGYDVEEGGDGGGCLWFHHYESFNIDQAADFLSLWLRALKSNKAIIASWACTCSKLRVDEFNGGGVLITADKVYWFNGQHLAEVASSGICMPPMSKLIHEAVDEAGWDEHTLLELLCQFMDKNPVAKHDFDAFLQRRVEDDLEASDDEET